MNLAKTDVFEKYSLVYTWSSDDTKRDLALTTLRVALDTPDSFRTHRTSLDLAYDGSHRFLNLEAQVPYRQLKTSLRYEWTEGKKQLKGDLRTMGRNVGAVNAALKSDNSGRYEMAAQASYLDVQVLDWTGSLHMQGTKASAGGKLESFFHPPVQFSGDCHASRDAVTVSASVDSTPFSAELTGHVRKNRDSLVLKGEASYSAHGQEWKVVGVNGKYAAGASGTLDKHNAFLSIEVVAILTVEFSFALKRPFAPSIPTSRSSSPGTPS